mmetsp:Transcript_17060/g.22332  ORF Transcript_17060/g.22332 Transcript_17060/m.22332 type:complete len:113 (-) Transcript_17060:787-1125(-)
MGKDVRKFVSPDSLNPGARADLMDDFNKWSVGLRAAAMNFAKPVLCVSGNEQYLIKMRSVWASAFNNNKLETVHITGLSGGATVSHFRKKTSTYLKCLVEFADSISTRKTFT